MGKDKCESNDGSEVFLTSMSGENNWVSGYCRVCCVRYIFQAKVNDTASEAGINGGRICKLCICCVEIAGKHINQKEVANYNHGWNIVPESDNDQLVSIAI